MTIIQYIKLCKVAENNTITKNSQNRIDFFVQKW